VKDGTRGVTQKTKSANKAPTEGKKRYQLYRALGIHGTNINLGKKAEKKGRSPLTRGPQTSEKRHPPSG